MASAVTSEESSERAVLPCATRYPLLLVHGVGVRDDWNGVVWGRIPRMLRENGAVVYFGEQDGWNTPLNNAVHLLERLRLILAETGATKVNIIAHSKGGLDARYLIALLSSGLDGLYGLDSNCFEQAVTPLHEQARDIDEGIFSSKDLPIASLTTISTPHHGSLALELLLSTFRPVFVPLAFLVNRVYKALGDNNPDFLGTCEYLTATHQRLINTLQPSVAPVFSQQYAGTLHGCFDDMTSFFTYSFISLVDGPNDGLVTTESAKYDNFCGVLSTGVGRGVPHALLVDSAKKPFSTLKPPGTSRPKPGVFSEGAHLPEQLGVSGSASGQTTSDSAGGQGTDIPLRVHDILDFYSALVADLKARGY